jgi:curved DNA-binding protein CbpA
MGGEEEDDPYQILGVPSTATADQIRAAYRSAVTRYHPDRHQGNPLADLAARKLTALNGAYELLSDPGRRAQYDARGGPRPGPRPDRPRAAGDGRALATFGRAVVGLVLLVIFVRLLPLLVRGLTAAGDAAMAQVGGLWLGLFGALALALLIVLLARRRRRRAG